MRQGVRYNITNEVVIGALLLPGGLGGARESTLAHFSVLGSHIDSGRADRRPTFRPCRRPMAREEERTLGSRGSATCSTVGRTDFPAPSGFAVRFIHTLCPGDPWACAQHALLLRQWNWGAYSSISMSGEIFFHSTLINQYFRLMWS